MDPWYNFQLDQPDVAQSEVVPTQPRPSGKTPEKHAPQAVPFRSTSGAVVSSEARPLLTPERFWSKVDRRGPDECWPWARSLDAGYGRFAETHARSVRAHAFAWRVTYHGPTKPGAVFRHSCDNTACCNPAHLYPGTHAENRADCVARGRQAKGDSHYSRLRPGLMRRGESVNTAKLAPHQVAEILAADGAHAVIAAKYGVSHDCIRKIKSGKTWRHLRIREDIAPASAFPAHTLDLAAIMRPEGREAHAGNYVTTEEC